MGIEDSMLKDAKTLQTQFLLLLDYKSHEGGKPGRVPGTQ